MRPGRPRVAEAKLLISLTLLAPAAALADETVELADTSTFDDHVDAPNNAIEIGFTSGYTLGAGKLGGSMGDLQDLTGLGISIAFEVAYRINPRFAVGVYGALAGFDGKTTHSDDGILGATAGIQGIVHLRPDRSIDPWVSLGAGWNGLWLDPYIGNRSSLQGFELVRVQAGVGYRVTRDVAIAPTIGGSLGMFVSQDSPMTDGYIEIQDKKVNFTAFAGVTGRFDVSM